MESKKLLGDEGDPLLRNTLGTGEWVPQIFLVDEDSTRRGYLTRELRGLGCEVQYFVSAEGALQLLEMLDIKRAPHLICYDGMLSGRGGGLKARRFLERLQRMPNLCNSQIMSYTSNPLEAEEDLLKRVAVRIQALRTQRRLKKASEQLLTTSTRMKRRSESRPPPRSFSRPPFKP